YRNYRSTASMRYNFSRPINEAAYPTTSYIDSGVNHSQRYYYIVRSVDAKGGEESNENEVSATALERIPPRPIEALEAQQLTNGGILLSWEHQQLSDVDHFNVYRSGGGPSPGGGQLLASTNLTSYEDLETVSGNTYSYHVRAVDEHENEDESLTWRTVLAVDVMPPEPPANLSIKAISGGSIELTWGGIDESNVTYVIYRTSIPDPSNATQVGSTNQTRYLDKDLVNGREYFYIVRSRDSAGNEEDNEFMVSAVASKSGPRIFLALALVAVFILGGFAVERRHRAAEAEG
ncbi:MAG: hypothetical protein HXS50_05095, partial [Theionarchaea archaeon]|nr:hypothetical protein [Theionarchaea archaeon]